MCNNKSIYYWLFKMSCLFQTPIFLKRIYCWCFYWYDWTTHHTYSRGTIRQEPLEIKQQKKACSRQGEWSLFCCKPFQLCGQYETMRSHYSISSHGSNPICSQVTPYGAPPDVYPAMKKNVSSCSMGMESGSLWGRFRLCFVLTFLSARIRCNSLISPWDRICSGRPETVKRSTMCGRLRT